METHDSVGCIVDDAGVVSLPMRDGNLFVSAGYSYALKVVSLPMRDGNIFNQIFIKMS